jgi:murein DD-endopeptidase MepM/ murein hydrolase activator NlpD
VALLTIGARAKMRVDKIRDVLDGLGVDSDRLLAHPPQVPSEGGPFIPLQLAANATPFESVAYEVQKDLAAADGLNRALTSVPLRRPFPHAEITSGFGARVDPFLGSNALHAGIDFREEMGAPVRATASGRIAEAGWVGGYGNMVEVDHGNGLATRYGHLSQILVTPGEVVTIGQILGRVGSTGRSTGPHLHYETRINGTPVDPMRFLRANRQIDSAS